MKGNLMQNNISIAFFLSLLAKHFTYNSLTLGLMNQLEIILRNRNTWHRQRYIQRCIKIYVREWLRQYDAILWKCFVNCSPLCIYNTLGSASDRFDIPSHCPAMHLHMRWCNQAFHNSKVCLRLDQNFQLEKTGFFRYRSIHNCLLEN